MWRDGGKGIILRDGISLTAAHIGNAKRIALIYPDPVRLRFVDEIPLPVVGAGLQTNRGMDSPTRGWVFEVATRLMSVAGAGLLLVCEAAGGAGSAGWSIPSHGCAASVGVFVHCCL